MLREIHSADELLAHLQDGGTVSGLRLQGVDLASAAGAVSYTHLTLPTTA